VNPAAFVVLLGQAGRSPSDRVASFTRAVQARQGLSLLHQHLDLVILGGGGAPHLILPDNGGVIWGHLFNRGAGWTRAVATQNGLGAPAETFVDAFWGGYVAIRRSLGATEVMRDPSGEVPCYHAAVDGTHIFTSRPHLLFDTGLLIAKPDWTIIAQALAWRDLRPARTALRGVSELQPGMAARISDDGLETRCIWTPWSFTRESPRLHSPDAAAEAVRDTVTRCLTAWSRSFQKPIVEISGGLDSAIVAAVARQSQDAPVGLTFAPITGDPDETPYARAVASHLGLQLETARLDLTDVDVTLSDARLLPRPCARNFAQALDRPSARLASAIGADVFFSGGGGDNVFGYSQSIAPVLDRLARQGIGWGTFATVNDVARIAQTDIWQVMSRVVRRRLRPRPKPLWKMRPGFLSAEVTASLPLPFGHPWLQAPTGALSGKHAHVMSLIGVQNHVECFGRLDQASLVFPLLSQPVMELCLSIPSWQWVAGGRNRAIARDAFADMLPASVIARQSKGAFDGFAVRLIDAYRDVLRTMLLGGALARQKLIDADAVARALDGRDQDDEAIVQILALADVEAWVRVWEAR